MVEKEFKIHETNVKEPVNSNVLKDNMELRKSLWNKFWNIGNKINSHA